MIKRFVFSRPFIIIAGLALSLLLIELGFLPCSIAWRKICAVFNAGGDYYNIYVVGGSTSVGEPYTPISFPEIIKYMFGGNIKGKPIKIINLAEAGCRAERQYWDLLRELTLKPKKNSALLVYSGINDVVAGDNDRSFKKWGFLQKSIIVSKIVYELNTNISMSGRIPWISAGRFSLDKYELIIEKIIKLARRHGVEVVISTLAGNISEFDPEDRVVYDVEEALNLLNPAKGYESGGNFLKPLELYEEILGMGLENNSYIYYRMGKCFQGSGRYKEAKQYYWKAVEYYDPRRPNSHQNEVIRNLAAKHNTGFADTLDAFEAYAHEGLMGYDLFWDAHHPTLKGYILMAKAFALELEKITGESISIRDPDERAVKEYFGFTDQDLFSIYISRIQWLCFHMNYASEPEERLGKAREYLARAAELEPHAPGTYLWKFMLAALGGEKDEALYWLEKGELLTKNSHVFSNRPWIAEWIDMMPEETVEKIRKLTDIND